MISSNSSTIEGIGTESPDYRDCPERGLAVYGEAFRTVFEYVFTNKIPGNIAEFGTYKGFTAGVIARLIREFESRVRFASEVGKGFLLFDSFDNFPESASEVDRSCYDVVYTKSWAPGTGAAPRGTSAAVSRFLEQIIGASRCDIIEGFYDEVLERSPISGELCIVNLDCDLYSSTKTVLESLVENGNLADGCVIMCDDYNCNRARPDRGERLAMSETFAMNTQYSATEFINYGWHGKGFIVHRWV